jgi:hypothetical protein
MGREFLRRLAARSDLPVAVSSIGRWWNADNSVKIDVVGVEDRTVVLAGSVKWAPSAGPSELARLRRAAEALPRRAPDVHLVLIARERVEGVSPGEAGAFVARDLYRA